MKHLVERFFGQIIECSDVGIQPEDEEGMKEVVPCGLQLGEEPDENEYSVKVSVCLIFRNCKTY